jgi:hypothetical protein
MNKIKMSLTEQEFINLMNLEGLNSGTYTDEGLKLLFEYFYNFTEDSISKIEILEQWDEYENIQEAKKDYNELDEDDDMEDFTTVLKDDSGIVVVQRF